jgi:hypothetical protein
MEERLRRWPVPPSLEGEAGRRLWLVVAKMLVLLLPRLWRVVWRLAGRLAGREAAALGVEAENGALGTAKGLWLWLC